MIISEQENEVCNTSSVVKIMSTVLNSEHETDQGREHFWTIGVNKKNIIQYVELVSLGSLSTAVVHPRETFRLAVMKGVAAIVLCHNHPSDDPNPSMEDITLTKRLSDAGKILGIEVLDHIIIGKIGNSFSFYIEGLSKSGSRFREALFHDHNTQWQFHTENYPASLRKRRDPKENKSSEAVAAAANP